MDKLNEIGFVDWNKFSLDERVKHLEKEFQCQSTGTAKAIFTLIKYYNDTKQLHKPVVSGSNFCELIAQHIKERNERLMKTMQVEIDCNHKWDEYGHGYKCSECGFYTGMNTTLNRLIDESLTH